MYGEEKLNDHYMLRYSLTKEFFETFSSLKYLKLEIPLTLIRNFHIYIKPFVNAHLSNPAYITSLQQKHRLKSIKDVQNALVRLPKIKRDLSQVPQRNMILMPGRLAPFALQQFPQSPVMFMISNKEDKKKLSGLILPQHMKKFNFYQKVRKHKVGNKKLATITQKAKKILDKQREHKLFGTSSFRKWLVKHLRLAMSIIKVLNRLIRKHPIRVIIDHVEIVNPGTTLSLLAKKFNLPFVNMPQVLISDRSLIPTRAAYYYVWGKNQKQWLQRRGIQSARIIETGNLGFEYARAHRYMPKNTFIKLLNIPEDHFIATYTTQPFDRSVNMTIVNWIQKSLDSLLPITIIIRPHPYDKIDYTALFNGSPQLIVDRRQLTLYDTLYNTDFIMTISSNTAIEAAMFGKGIFVLQPHIPYHYEHHNNEFNAHLVKASAGRPVFNQAELAYYLKKAVHQPTYRDFMREQSNQFFKQTLITSPTPSVRIRRLINHLLQKRK